MSHDKDKQKPGTVHVLFPGGNINQEENPFVDESKGIYTNEEMKERYPFFVVHLDDLNKVEYYHCQAMIRDGILCIYEMPHESWLTGKMTAVIRDWKRLEYM